MDKAWNTYEVSVKGKTGKPTIRAPDLATARKIAKVVFPDVKITSVRKKWRKAPTWPRPKGAKKLFLDELNEKPRKRR